MVSHKRSGRKSRKTRTSRKSRRYNRSRRHRGGFMAPISETAVGSSSMAGGHSASLGQGSQFGALHASQHGGSLGLNAGLYPGEVSRPSLLQQGGAWGSAAPAPMEAVTGSVLTTGQLVDSSRTGPLNDAISQISGMKDQVGGRRKGRGRKSRGRKQRGGFAGWGSAMPAPTSASYMAGVNESSAQLNNDWSAARDPNYWAPKN